MSGMGHVRKIADAAWDFMQSHQITGTPKNYELAFASCGREKPPLTQRVDARKLPYIDLVDLRIEAAKQRGLPALSGRLVRAMQDRFERRVTAHHRERGASPGEVVHEVEHEAVAIVDDEDATQASTDRQARALLVVSSSS